MYVHYTACRTLPTKHIFASTLYCHSLRLLLFQPPEKRYPLNSFTPACMSVFSRVKGSVCGRPGVKGIASPQCRYITRLKPDRVVGNKQGVTPRAAEPRPSLPYLLLRGWERERQGVLYAEYWCKADCKIDEGTGQPTFSWLWMTYALFFCFC